MHAYATLGHRYFDVLTASGARARLGCANDRGDLHVRGLGVGGDGRASINDWSLSV